MASRGIPLLIDEDREDLLLLLLKGAGKRDAIRLYREETGADYDDARLAVEELASRRGVVARSYRAMTALILTVLVGLAGVVYFGGVFDR